MSKHPKGMAAVEMDGITWQVNRYGVILTEQQDTGLPGWNSVTFAPREVEDRLREIIHPAFIRRDRGDKVYDLRKMRQLLDGHS